MKRVVFTDLDGTLLDAHSYSPAASVDALRLLTAHDVLLVFTSSKTRAEQEILRSQLGITDPFIVENGSAIVFEAEQQVLGLAADEVRWRLAQINLETGLGLRGYADCTVAEIAALTGLSYDAAKCAQQRDYSETIITSLNADSAQQLQAACVRVGLRCFSGGRFYTVTGAEADKGSAVHWLTGYYRARFGDVRTFGIGDSANDLPMLTTVEQGYLVQRPDGTWLDAGEAHIERVRGIGPHGFSAAVRQIITQMV